MHNRLSLSPLRAVANSSKYEPLLKGTDPDHRDLLIRILEKAERAADRWGIDASDFAYPPVIADAQLALGRISGVAAGVPWGGHISAERQRMVVGHPELIAALETNPASSEMVQAVEVAGNFLFDPATHRDFLGAILGAGIQRDRVGDIVLTGEKGAHMLTTPELAEYLVASLKQVRSVPVQCSLIPLDSLKITPPKMKELSSSEASLRIDAVASAGFQISRSKMADMIDGGDVRLNWRDIVKKNVDVKEGDVISVRGKGRIVVTKINETKRERYQVEMKRYL